MGVQIHLNDPDAARDSMADTAVLLGSFRVMTEQELETQTADLLPLILQAKTALAEKKQQLLEAMRDLGPGLDEIKARLTKLLEQCDLDIRRFNAYEERAIDLRRRAEELVQECRELEDTSKSLLGNVNEVVAKIVALK